MFTLIKNGYLYTPDEIGKKDILIVIGKIACIDDTIEVPSMFKNVQVIDAQGKLVVPGFIDPHVHIAGAGGEGGYKNRTPEISLSDITRGGVTTVVGCLGTDGFGRNLITLISKARALEDEGISTYLYTGSYQLPLRTVTDHVETDIILVNKFIGVGEVAISDHRSSQPTIEDVAKVAAAARVGGMLTGKAGIVNIHIGDGARKLSFLETIVDTTEIPITQFYPTHMNRNPDVFENGIRYAKRGGYVDFTTSTTPQFLAEGEVKCSKALRIMLEHDVPIGQITFSSDAQGSLPAFDEKGNYLGLDVGKVSSLFAEVRDAILEEHLDIPTALRVITANPATILKLTKKGYLKEGLDGDVVFLEPNTLAIDTVIAKGMPMILHGEIIKKGTFEK